MAKQNQKINDFGQDWKADKAKGYCGHFDPTTGEFTGPDDAFVWFGLPWSGPDSPAEMLGGQKVERVAWDEETGCGVYRRIIEEVADAA